MHSPLVILGANGWIGSHLAAHLASRGEAPLLVDKSNIDEWLSVPDPVEKLFYCIGLTSDFRDKPYETVEAHVSLLSKVIQVKDIEKFVYLSSTRVYQGSNHGSEDQPVIINSAVEGDIYNISKLMGESIVLNNTNNGFKVVRLSNVVGPGQPENTFLGSLLKDAKQAKKVIIKQHEKSSKDYINISDVVRYLDLIADCGLRRSYNIASGTNTTHAQVAAWLQQEFSGTAVEFSSSPQPAVQFPSIRIDRILSEFPPPAAPLQVA